MPTEMTDLQVRLDTYKTWPLTNKQKVQKLAEAGFYYTGIVKSIFF